MTPDQIRLYRERLLSAIQPSRRPAFRTLLSRTHVARIDTPDAVLDMQGVSGTPAYTPSWWPLILAAYIVELEALLDGPPSSTNVQGTILTPTARYIVADARAVIQQVRLALIFQTPLHILDIGVLPTTESAVRSHVFSGEFPLLARAREELLRCRAEACFRR